MNEFTKEFIEKLRTFNKNILDNELSIQHPFLNMHTSVFMSALDEIQRLQARVQELEVRVEWLDGDRKQLSEKIFAANKRIAELKNELMFYQM